MEGHVERGNDMCKRIMVVTMSTVILSLPCWGQDTTKSTAPIIRKGLFHTESVSQIKIESMEEETEPDQYSIFSFGVMLGVSYTLEERNFYKVQNGVVVVDRMGKMSDRILPAFYALPSINLLGTSGRSLSAIVPLNYDPSANLSYGIGLSYGFNTLKTAEVGLSLVAIWSDAYDLNEAQRTSLETNQPLPPNESSEFPKTKVISIGLGIYVLPFLK